MTYVQLTVEPIWMGKSGVSEKPENDVDSCTASGELAGRRAHVATFDAHNLADDPAASRVWI
jgi:hypothetical protein